MTMAPELVVETREQSRFSGGHQTGEYDDSATRVDSEVTDERRGERQAKEKAVQGPIDQGGGSEDALPQLHLGDIGQGSAADRKRPEEKIW